MPASPRAFHPTPAHASGPSRAHPYAAGPSQHCRRSPVQQQQHEERRLPPSPPRSRRDASATPPAHPKPVLDAGDNYWDDVPPPPASLKSILDSFRRSGEGDRDLLMSILGAKKAEEDRLTAIIQTRLTILQARLNIAAIQAQMPPAMDPAQLAAAYRQDRTPSLSHGSTSSSNESSPPAPAHLPPPHSYYSSYASADRERERIHLPPPNGYDRERLSALCEDERAPRDPRDRSLSVGGRPAGLEMLLEGVREAERKERV